jgi:hypothetical protein
MRRLVYAPKVWIFIRSSNLGGQIFDVSSDVVRGSVTQNLGDLSKARFELRNRGWKWVRYRSDDAKFDKKQVFLPMDLCTIWMQRIAGRPIQVFTGYLDSVPYYQAYPGVAIFEASCTLKKLAFNWFDPGLPVFQNWLRDNGWIYDPVSGQVQVGLKGIDDRIGLGQSGAGAGRAVSDAQLGSLIGRFMVDIAGWDPQDVVIGNLPVNVAKAAANLKAELNGEFAEARAEAVEFFSSLLSLNGAEGFATNPGEISPPDRFGDANSRGNPPQNLPAITKIVSAASRANIPAWVPVFAALLLSGMTATRQVTEESQEPFWGYGLYSMRPTSELQLDNGKTIFYIDGQPISNVLDPGVATEIFCRRLNRHINTDAKKAIKDNDAEAAIRWINTAIGYELDTSGVDLGAVFQKANQIAATQKSIVPEAFPTQAVKPSDVPPSSPVVQNRLTTTEKHVLAEAYKNLVPEMGFVILVAKNFNSNLTLEKPKDSLNTNQIFIKGPPVVLQKFFDSLEGNTSFSRVELFVNGENQVLQNGTRNSSLPSKLKDRGIILTGNIEELRKLQAVIPQVQEVPPATEHSEAGITLQQLAIFAANAAFAANFAFDSNVLLARHLVGEKALMNDTSCLDAIKQLCQASLRTFRSLPDGRFMAFYPDYFGAHRKPYWTVRNIEIVDFGIQLNDQALATHVYVIGDSTMGVGNGINTELLNTIASEGVATITQANMLDSFIARESDSESGVTRLEQAINFVEHYGARPHKESMPLIRNRDYEFLMAWQKFMWLWAQQFATTVQLTFQPEIMAGGLIHFEDHHIQMFCESVTHSFDYEGGFTTQAILVAPSLDKSADRSSMPGFALAGGVNSVGPGVS